MVCYHFFNKHPLVRTFTHELTAAKYMLSYIIKRAFFHEHTFVTLETHIPETYTFVHQDPQGVKMTPKFVETARKQWNWIISSHAREWLSQRRWVRENTDFGSFRDKNHCARQRTALKRSGRGHMIALHIHEFYMGFTHPLASFVHVGGGGAHECASLIHHCWWWPGKAERSVKLLFTLVKADNERQKCQEGMCECYTEIFVNKSHPNIVLLSIMSLSSGWKLCLYNRSHL